MTNNEYNAEVSKASAYANKLFYIPLNGDSGELKDFLEYLEFSDVKNLFPEIEENEWEETINDRENPVGLLQVYGYEGWLIELHIPNRSNFRFIEGKEAPVAWNVNHWNCWVEYIYCESFEDILPKIKEVSELIFKRDLAADKAEQRSEEVEP